MLIGSFFSWWYGLGWKGVIQSFGPRYKGVLESFSVEQLSRTIFAPWRRIITYPGASLGEKVQAKLDNLFSRGIGFVVRFFVLLAALFTIIVMLIFTALEIVLWPLMPVLVPALIIKGIIG